MKIFEVVKMALPTSVAVTFLALTGLAQAQSRAPQQSTPVEFDDDAPPPPQFEQNGPVQVAQQAPPANNPANAHEGEWRRMRNRPPAQGADAPPPQQLVALPRQLTIRPGTYFTVRVNQALHSDHNQNGDVFSATLVKPVVVDGIVVAERGQTLGGRVTEAVRAGRIKGTSRLAIELTDFTLVDGTQVPIHSQLTGASGSTSLGRDASAIGTTTAVGAAVGAAAAGGAGAAMGAGAGAGAAIIGVLLTRGNPTVIYPETVLTFRVNDPIIVSTERAPQSFRGVTPGDYDRPGDTPRTVVARPSSPGPYYGSGWGGYWGPGYSYGRSIGIGFYGGSRFGGGGFHGGGRRR